MFLAALFTKTQNWKESKWTLIKIDKQTVAYLYIGVLQSNKKNELLIHTATMTLPDKVEQNKPETEEYKLYDSTNMKLKNRQN